MTISPQNLELLDGLSLSAGVHEFREDGLNALEAVAWIAGLPHCSDPECTSEILASYVRVLNDTTDDEQRSRLIPFIPRLIDTAAGYDIDLVWSHYLAWKAVCVFMPIALRMRGQHVYALQLEAQTNLYEVHELTESIGKKIKSGKLKDDTLLLDALWQCGQAALFSVCLPKTEIERQAGIALGYSYGRGAAASARCISNVAALGSPSAWDQALLALEETLMLGELVRLASAYKALGETYGWLSTVSSGYQKGPGGYPCTSTYYIPVGPILELRLRIDRDPL